MSKPDKRLFIFDFDGVVVDSGQAQMKSWIALFEKEYDCTIDHNALPQILGKKLSDQFQEIVKKNRLLLSASAEENYESLFRELFLQNKSEILIQAKLAPFLEALPPTNLYCIATNAPTNKVQEILKGHRLYDLFLGKVHSAYDLLRWKPQPDLFLNCAQQYEVPPQQCVVIEDSAEGVTAAAKANMQCLYFDPQNERLVEEPYTQRFEEFNKILQWLLNQREHSGEGSESKDLK